MSHDSKKVQFDTGISTQDQDNICQSLSKLLADTYLLYIKTQNFHWNVEGKHFKQLHEMFEEQYEELAGALDSIAERIRAVGHYAPATYAAFNQMSRIKEEAGIPKAKHMVYQLAEDHALVIRFIRSQFNIMQAAKDEASIDLLIQRLQSHEKILWMLRSFLTEHE